MAAPERKGKNGGRPGLFLFCTYCSISESMRRAEFALFISGMAAGLH